MGARKRTRIAAIVAGFAVLASVLVPMTAAQAAGPAVVSVTTSITNPDGAVITEVDASTMAYYSVNVAYSCSVADCEDVQVVVDPTVLDPTYGEYRKESAVVFVPPFSPAPPFAGSLDTGYTISLGNVTAGTGGSFALQYRINARYSGPQGGSFFLDGSPIMPQATITAVNSDNPASNTASASWVSSVPGAPTLGVSLPASTRTDQPVTVDVTGDSRCLSYNAASALLGIPWLTCAASYEATVTLPVNAVYVAGSGGTYNAGAHTVTFAQSGQQAAGGLPYNENSFQVTFPSTEYPTAGAGCVVSEAFSATETMTYLDGTLRTATPASRSIQAQNCTPFAKGTMYKYVASRDAGSATDPILHIPTAPGETKNSYWEVTAANQSNVTGVATITDNDLDQPDLPVNSLRVIGTPATVTYTLDDSTTDTITLAAGATWSAPTGQRITAVTATSESLIGPNPTDSGTAETRFAIRFNFSLVYGATPGTRTNTASTTIEYPDNPELGTLDVGSISRTVTLQEFTDVTLAAGAPGAAAQGGGTPVVGGNVTWSMRGTFDNVAPGSDYRPQYVFLAPQAWEITPGSATVAGVTGVTYDYQTATYNGQTYDAVVATWPGPITDAGNFNLPAMNVMTTPTGAAVAGTNNQTAYLFAGDANNGAIATYYPTSYADATDFDGDTNVTEQYAVRSGSTSLAPTRALGVTKEICRPDVEQADGCDWIADSSVLVGVAPSATSIKYRVTIENAGNADLDNVVAYDVLPFIGDTGTTDATASTPRGSTVGETLSSVSDVSPGLTLTYSTSTNPDRPEVYTGTTDMPDWGSTVAGASAIRAEIAALPAGTSVTFAYEAALVGGSADQVACNSVAANADTLAAIEPAAVCATTQEADLRLAVPDRLPLQQDRPGVVPFTVTNLGGSVSAPASVTVEIPLGMTVTGLTPEGWSCVTDPATAAPIIGPATLACAATETDGTPRTLDLDVPDQLNIPVVPTVSTPLCVPGTVSGSYSDPVLPNNDAEGCFAVVAASAGVQITKTNGLTWVAPGQEYTYTLTVENQLVAEALTGATVTDTLPAGVAFVSASGGGAVSGQGAADGEGNLPGGTVTWSLPALQPAGVSNGDGDGTTGGAGANRAVTVTVKVLPDATGSVVNEAQVAVPDPADSALTLTDDDSDTDVLRGFTVEKTASVASAKPGDTVTYSVIVTNPTPADYTAADPASFTDELAGVLDDAEYNNDASGGATFSGHVLSWSGPLAGGTSVTITYSVTVDSPDRGDHLLDNVVTTPADGSCASGSSATECATSTPVQSFRVVKSSPSTEVTPGETVEFTITVTNTGQVPYTTADPASFTDDLSDVLDDAVYDGNETGGASYTDPVLSWSGALAIGASATITYSITINDPNGGDDQLSNTVVTPNASGGNCAVTSTDPACSVQVPARGYSVVKTASDSVVNPGATVEYAITVTNTGAVDYTSADPASFSDSLADVLDDASYDGNITGGATVVAGVVSWSGALEVGESETFEYSVTVTDPVAGDQALTNRVLTPAGAGGSCTVDSTDADCGTRTVVRSYTVTKSASADSVLAGGTLEYQVVVTNTGLAAYTSASPASFSDDLSGVLDDAVYNNDADQGASYSAPELSWAGALPLGGTVTVSYSVTAEQPDAGDRLLENAVVTAAGTGGDCAIGSADCATSTPVQAFQVEKTASTDQAGAGDTVVYTVTVTNTGLVDYTSVAPAGFRDDLSEVLDDARYNGDVLSDGGGEVSYTAPELAWTGALPAGETATVTYSATVTMAADGDDRMLNTIATGPGGQLTTLGGNCLVGSDSELCWAQTAIERPSAGLPFTGANPMGMILAGTLALLLGAAAMAVSRLRRLGSRD